MKKKKILWLILLILGIIPIAIPLVSGIYSAFAGSSGLCFTQCNYVYGLEAFLDSVVLYSYLFWPTYIVGLILIIISIKKLRAK